MGSAAKSVIFAPRPRPDSAEQPNRRPARHRTFKISNLGGDNGDGDRNKNDPPSLSYTLRVSHCEVTTSPPLPIRAPSPSLRERRHGRREQESSSSFSRPQGQVLCVPEPQLRRRPHRPQPPTLLFHPSSHLLLLPRLRPIPSLHHLQVWFFLDPPISLSLSRNNATDVSLLFSSGKIASSRA